MRCLTPYLVALVRDTLNQPDWYDWRMPTTFPADVAPALGSLIDQTRSLKFALCDAYAREESRRVELATYYVREWGGVRGNRVSTLERYVLNEPEVTIREQRFKGISTWSKVLHLRNPRRFFIYDSRVAVALNLAQVNNDLPKPIAFPIPESKSRLIRATRRKLTAMAKQGCWRQPSAQMYEEYNELMMRIGREIDIEADIIEMALFSQAPAMAAGWLESVTGAPMA